MTEDILAVLRRSQEWGFLGPGPVGGHIDHSQALIDLLHRHWPDGGLRGLDLRSGGGVPGLIVATALPHSRWTLLDAMDRRTAFLASATRSMGLTDRVEVVRDRAEVTGRDPNHRGNYDVVTARSFAVPAVTAECAAPFLRIGGLLVLSEPPDGDPSRWSHDGLATLGLDPAPVDAQPWISFRLVRECPERFPRQVGRPGKRPLWRP